MENEWPKLDPVTNRKICQSCWEGVHYKKLIAVRKEMVPNGNGGWREVRRDIYQRADGPQGAENACNGECECMHLEIDATARELAQRLRESRKARRQMEQEALANSPLAVRGL